MEENSFTAVNEKKKTKKKTKKFYARESAVLYSKYTPYFSSTNFTNKIIVFPKVHFIETPTSKVQC